MEKGVALLRSERQTGRRIVVVRRRCRNCGRLRVFGSRDDVLCRGCEATLRPQIYEGLVALDDARHALEFARDEVGRRAALDDVITCARALEAFEKKGIPTSLPTPSELLAEYTRQRGEMGDAPGT